ncbi:MAG: hypothetical protein ACI8S6_000246 [Myxococcota bacterium]|jgi:hypothetical protein
MEPTGLTPDMIMLFIGVLLAFLLTLGWIGVNVVGAITLGNSLSAVSKRMKTAWGLSIIGGFMGPCVIPVSLVALVMALIELRGDDVSPETLKAGRYVTLSTTIILVMAMILAVCVVASQVLRAAPAAL